MLTFFMGKIRRKAVRMLKEFGPSIYAAEGPTVSFFGFPYPTRMAMVRLSNGKIWVWSPIALTEELAGEVQEIGPVCYIVSPNKMHHLFLGEWTARWPEALLFAPPGLTRKRPTIHFHAELSDEPDPSWASDIDQAIFRGSVAMAEVVFFHRASSTAIIGDLIQRFPEQQISGSKGMLMRFSGVVGEHGGTPWDWRASFVCRGRARAALQKVLTWNSQRLLIAHGQCAPAGASEIIKAALRWM